MHPTQVLVLSSAILTLCSHAATPDELVYGRYEKGYMKTGIKFARDWTAAGYKEFKFVELKKPATAEDVKNKKAIFTFQGLVPNADVRVKKLLRKCPFSGDWVTMKKYLWHGEAGHYDQLVKICQAEEIKVGGKWKLYYGVISVHGKAVVPAEELEFNLYKPASYFHTSYKGGVDWSIDSPVRIGKDGRKEWRPLEVGHPVKVDVRLRNRKAVSHRMPADLCRKMIDGKYSLRKGVQFQLKWAPYDPEDVFGQGASDSDFEELKGKWLYHKATTDWTEKREPGEIVKAFTVDLSKVYDLKPGEYKFTWRVDEKALGLTEVSRQAIGGCWSSFRIGNPTPKITAKDLNKKLGMFANLEAEGFLNKAIKDYYKDWSDKKDGTQLKADALKFDMEGDMSLFVSYFGEPSKFVLFFRSNYGLVKELDKYTTSSVREAFETHFEKAKVKEKKLFCAVYAAKYGSQAAAFYIFEMMKATDKTNVEDASSALSWLVRAYDAGELPEWLSHLAICRMDDRRCVIDSGSRSGIPNRINGGASGWRSVLAYNKCSIYYPRLLKEVDRSEGDEEYISFLTYYDKQSSKDMVEKWLKYHLNDYEKGRFKDEDTAIRQIYSVMQSAAELECKEVLPDLFKHYKYRFSKRVPDRGLDEYIAVFRKFGDKRAVPLLQMTLKKVETREEQTEDSRGDYGDILIALAELKEGDPHPRLVNLFDNKALDEFQQREILWSLRKMRDRRSIPTIAKALKNKRGSVSNSAIDCFADFPYPESVDALIGAFDIDFKGQVDWKRAYKPEMFYDHIAEILQRLTGQKIPAKKALWKKWWEKNRNNCKLK